MHTRQTTREYGTLKYVCAGGRAMPEKPSWALTCASSIVRPAAAASSAQTRCMTGPSSVTLNVPAAAETSCAGRPA